MTSNCMSPLQGVISRLHCPLVNGHRVSLKLTDGALVTYDLYHAIESHPGRGDYTLCVCPGIGNNSESVYIRSAEMGIFKKEFCLNTFIH